MKTHIYLTSMLALTIQVMVKGQTPENRQAEENEQYWTAYCQQLKLTEKEKAEFLLSKKRAHTHSNTFQSNTPGQKPTPPSSQIASSGCTNIDFENGNLSGWTTSCGFHPIWNNAGCCNNPGGQQTVLTGNGTDPYGNFPVVAPGGNFSLRLGNNATGGQADRIEQSFLVSAANANFTYRYAVVLQEPGHVPAQQPAFVIEMFDNQNNAIPCTYYNVSAGQNIPGFQNALNGVIFKPWTNVTIDLTNYIGQMVTIRFTTYDCALGGHFGYAYIDGICDAFQTTSADTICIGQPKTLCAPNGFGSYLWVGGSVNGQTTQCVTVNTPGNYSVQTTMVTNCQGPTFSYPILSYPNPLVSFSVNNNNNPCNTTIQFINTSGIASGNMTYLWNFGDNSSSTQVNPTHIYNTPGTYTVTLTATSNKGCVSASQQVVTIYQPPVASFIHGPICLNAPTNFTNTSSAPQGNIIQWTWNISNLSNSAQQHPSVTFNSSGLHSVTLSVISNYGCASSVVQQVSVNPLPIPNFNANYVCLGGITQFTNVSSPGSGFITNYLWNFGGNNTSTATHPNFQYNQHGIFQVQLTAVTNNNCIGAITKTVQVYANPVVNFSAQNACANTVLNIVNNTQVQGAQISNWNWNFGNNNFSQFPNPLYAYNTPGNYNITLQVTSSQGCNASGTAAVTIYDIPQTGFNSSPACLNQSTQFVNTTIINNSNIAKWRWDFENDGVWDDTVSVNPSYIYPNFGNYNCRLQAISNHNCSAQSINQVTIHPNPVALFKANSACLGEKTTFTNLSYAPGSYITSYQWQYYGDGFISNVYPNAGHVYQAPGTYLVKLEVQNAYGCVNTLSKPVYVNAKPIANFITGPAKGCEKVCVDFTNLSSISQGSIVTAQWLFGDGSQPAYGNNPKHCFRSGIYHVTLKIASDSGCTAMYTAQNAVEVYPNPVASFEVEPYEVDELEPTVTVSGNASGADQIRYYINDGSIYLTNNFSHSFNNLDLQVPVIFQVVKNNYGCSDTTSRTLKIKKSFAIYIPNTFTPNEDGLNDGFMAKGYNIKEFSIRIYDRWGHVVFESNDINNAWDGRTKNSSEPIKNDVYVWQANVVDINNKTHQLTGHVTLLK